MAFGGLSDQPDAQPVAEINMIPLIDVMLVLLVIFMVTAPLLTHSVKVDLPKASSQPTESHAESVQLAIDASGALYWNNERIANDQLDNRLRDAAARDPQTEVQIRADGDIAYKRVVGVMSQAGRNGLTHIGFVTDPTNAP